MMRYAESGGKVYIYDVECFDPGETLTCGQVFRFRPEGSGYILIAGDRRLYMERAENGVCFHGDGLNESAFRELWEDYFDLNRDYADIRRALSQDGNMANALAFAPGIRILRQDPWETLISFIISQNNRIPQIQRVIENICRRYGDPIGDTGDYAFPTPERLARADIEGLMECRAGFRAKYIIDAVGKVLKGDVDLYGGLEPAAMKEQLMGIRGVGDKVADCVMLFAYGRFDYFPVDTWVRRIMNRLYFDGREAGNEAIQNLAAERFGACAGFAQQYLFIYARTTDLK